MTKEQLWGAPKNAEKEPQDYGKESDFNGEAAASEEVLKIKRIVIRI